MRLLWLAALLLLVPCRSSADSLDDSIRKQIAAERCPGLSLAVVKDGRIVKLGAYGYANLEWLTPTTIDTKYEVASVSKMVTGAAFRALVEEGKVREDDLLTKYFDGLPETWQGIRLRHLITMSTGFPEDFGSDLVPYGQDVLSPADDASLMRMFSTLPFLFPMGTRFSYSSVNYALMGMIISKASGTPYATYMQKHVFDPAGMADSSIIDNWAIVPHRAQGYRLEKGVIRRGWYLGQYLHSRADDSVLTTARDLARFIIALQEGRIVKQTDKLWQATVSDTGVPLDYSYGWNSTLWLGHRRLEHSGGYRTGFHTFVARFPDDGVSVIVLTNCDYSQVRRTVMQATMRYIRGIPDPAAEARKTDPDPAQTRRLVAGLDAARNGRIDPSVMLPDGFEPESLSDIAEFLQPITSWKFAGRTVLRKPIVMHGHRLVQFETLQGFTGETSYFLTQYMDGSGKVAYTELTT